MSTPGDRDFFLNYFNESGEQRPISPGIGIGVIPFLDADGIWKINPARLAFVAGQLLVNGAPISGGAGVVGPGTADTIAKFSGDGSTVADATGITADDEGNLNVQSLNVMLGGVGISGGLTLADQAAPVDAVAASATVAASGTPGDGNIVTVNGQPYTFKSALTPSDYEVLINGQDGSLTNLEHAINGTGGTPGTDYQAPAAHPDVTAADVSGSSITLTAIIRGAAGNLFTLTKAGANLSISDFATGATGVDGTPGTLGEVHSANGRWYFCTADADLTTAGAWKIQVLGDL